MSGGSPALVAVALAIAALVLLVARWKVHPFLAFIVVSALVALALGMPPADVAGAVRKGIGGALGGLAIVIVAGAMLGKLVVESGAAERVATEMVRRFGEKRMAWAMAATGFVVGIPLFYGVGFVLLVPIVFACVGRFGLPPLVVGMPALAAMSVAHGLLPPHPAPTALVAAFDADLGRTLLLGIVVAVPALVLAGPVFSRTLSGVAARPLEGLAARSRTGDDPPGLAVSVATSLLPALLLVGATVAEWSLPPAGGVAGAVRLLSDPDLVMILTLGVAAVTLGIRRGRTMPEVMTTCSAAIGDVASILLMIGGSGAFKQVLVETGVDRTIAAALGRLPLDPLFLGWLVTAAIRVCVGSATVAGLTAAGLLEPVVAAGGVDPDLMVLSIGAGSLALSHVNDGAFWMFKEYFRVSLADTLRTWTVMETIVSVAGLAGVLVLSRVL